MTMEPNPRDAHRRVREAVEELAISEQSLPDRLGTAVLAFIIFDPQDFPTPEMAAEYRQLIDQVTRLTALEGEGKLRATTRQMSDDEAKEHIGTIVRLFRRLTEYLATHDDER